MIASLAPSSLPSGDETGDIAAERVEREEEFRAIRALRILLESRLIDQLEFERRLAAFQDNVPSQTKG
jgi:hypothetical protein